MGKQGGEPLGTWGNILRTNMTLAYKLVQFQGSIIKTKLQFWQLTIPKPKSLCHYVKGLYLKHNRVKILFLIEIL